MKLPTLTITKAMYDEALAGVVACDVLGRQRHLHGGKRGSGSGRVVRVVVGNKDPLYLYVVQLVTPFYALVHARCVI